MSVDSTDQRRAILDLPLHLRDALARVDTAAIPAQPSAGLAVCGMGGSGVGAQLAAVIIGARATRPIIAVRGHELPAWVGPNWTVLLSSYSGETEETLACWEAAAHARRIVVATGGELVERGRSAGVSIISLPAGFQPRAAVGYSVVAALEVAALCGVAEQLRREVEGAAALLGSLSGALEEEARALAGELRDCVPVFYGAGATVPVAYRWKSQVNENANRAAFWSELPEAGHNEIEGWSDRSVLAPVFLEDLNAPSPIARRFAAMADIIGGATRVMTRGETAADRVLSLVHLGDLFSLHLAYAHGTDPVDIPALDRLKREL